MRLAKPYAVILIMISLGFAQVKLAQESKSLKTASRRSLEQDMDKTVSPCMSFYPYACGKWMKDNPIPPDQSRWGQFNELTERNREILHAILEKAAKAGAQRSALEQKYGDFYGDCMDEKTVEAKAATPLKPELDRIAAIKSREDLIAEIAHLQGKGVGAVFSFGPSPNLHDARQMIANVDQGGLSLPDRDYYIKDDPKTKETREKFVVHVQKIFALLGDPPEAGAAKAQTVLAIETELAKASMDRTLRRDPKNRDHKMKVAELAALAPNFAFSRFFEGAGAPRFEELNVVNPDFFKQINQMLQAAALEDWKTYLRWHLARVAAPLLSSAFVNENFDFYGRYLTGQKEIQARWKRCVSFTDRLLGEAVGQAYVAETFGPEGKERAQKMVVALEKALEKDIRTLAWMTPATKEKAVGKLHAITNKIGYPDKWRDYSALKIQAGDWFGNFLGSLQAEFNRQMGKIGKPADKKEWSMTPPTVNAYYSPPNNDINFPAGILQPPFFDKNADDALNFGGIGVVIGHELTHGFDDQGSKFDAEGNLNNWWTDEDRQEFEKRTACLADEYSQFVTVKDSSGGDVKLNGRLTLGENTADNGGARIALMALLDTIGDAKDKKIGGFTPEQRFFLAFGQIWCQNATEEIRRQLQKVDPHSPGQFRVIGVVQNMPEFQNTFGCKKGEAMVSEQPCRVW